MNRGNFWTDEEVFALSEAFYATPWPELVALFPGRNMKMIQSKARHLSLERKPLRVIPPLTEPIFIGGKRCSKCFAVLPIARFRRDKNRKDGKYPQCLGCISAFQKEWAQRPEVIERNKSYQLEYSRTDKRKAQIKTYATHVLPCGLTRARRMKIKAHFGLTEIQYFNILSKQGNACATCFKIFSSHSEAQIDHCHATGVVRGILCTSCNRALGQVADDPDVLRALAAYLEAA